MNNTETLTRLINFHIPTFLLDELDSLVKFRQMTRTGVLNSLIESFIDNEHQKLKENGKMKHLERSKELLNQINKPDYKKVKTTLKRSYRSDTNYDTGSDFLMDLGK